MNIRLFKDDDSVEAINHLLRDAYAPLAELGLNYSAATEDLRATLKNIKDGECYLGFEGEEIVCTVVLRSPRTSPPFPVNPIAWYNRTGVANFGRLAVSPAFQGKKLASEMMDYIESRSIEVGCCELALDTSEKAAHLIQLYSRRKYRLVDHHQWPGKTYRSVIMSKKL